VSWFRRAGLTLRRTLGGAVRRAGGVTRSDIARLHGALAVRDRRLDVLAATLDGLSAQADSLQRAHNDLGDRVRVLEGLLSIDALSRFIRHTRLRREPLVSVVLPTYDRPDRLRRAIESVLAQRYTHWELLVVDDGGEADSHGVVVEIADPRVRWMAIEHAGVCAARNAALAIVRGEVVAYLDDDNAMDSDWLYAVVWAFEQRPEVDVLYGAFVVDDPLRVGRQSSGELPRTVLSAWNREVLRQRNLADIGAIAHRSGLPEARFDEGLRQLGDWDLLLRLTKERDPLVLPAIACYYMTDAPNRLTGGPTYHADLATVTARGAALAKT